MGLSLAKYDDDDAYYVVNKADYEVRLNSVDGAPEIIQELRRETIEIILRQARTAGEQVVKVAMGSRPLSATVKGYATFLRFLNGSDLADLEKKLGFKAGVLQSGGAYLYHVNPLSLNTRNIAPRGNTDWSAGVTPRDLHNLSQTHGVSVGYHRNYPPAVQPIFQFAILEPVPFLGQPRFIKLGETV
jgi:hypothetical protein